MADGGWGATAFATAILLVLAALAPSLTLAEQETRLAATTPPADGIADPHAPTFDEAWARDLEHGLAWSTEHKDTLVSPLVTGTAHAGWANATIESYQDGIGWATDQLARTDRTDLDRAVDRVLDRVLPKTPLLPERPATNVDLVPDAYVGPLATLLTAQLIADTDEIDTSQGPYTAARDMSLEGAWLLGVIETTLPHLEQAASHHAPDAPITVDGLGLVILGSKGDDHYDGATLGPLYINGAILLVEPGGNETYDIAVASETDVDITTSQTGRIGTDWGFGAIALELGGNDTYNDKIAAGIQGTSAWILVDEHGDDLYGSRGMALNVAAAEIGLAYLGDEEGDDTYLVNERGIGFARTVPPIRPEPAIAILGDWEGDDSYQTARWTDGETRGRAVNVGAIATFRDYEGKDDHEAHDSSYGGADRDGIGVFVDDGGVDSYYLYSWGAFDSFGSKWTPGMVFPTGPAGRSLASFTDGGGNDSYSWTDRWQERDPFALENNKTKVRGGEHTKYSVFVDCQTEPDARFPCESEQGTVLQRIVESEIPG